MSRSVGRPPSLKQFCEDGTPLSEHEFGQALCVLRASCWAFAFSVSSHWEDIIPLAEQVGL